jgi:S1-C subfamily serine protease
LDAIPSLPSFPAKDAMTPVELAERTKALVFIVTPDGLGASALDLAPVGAGLLLMASERGYLLATNRHVADAPAAFRIGGPPQGHVLVISSGRQYARAEIVGRHKDLDLALLWVDRGGGNQRFRQPISPYTSIPVGAAVFVIGHPQRLFFTLSNGLISRVDGTTMLQLTAPVSPGNSGGPVYDPQGNLLGVVTLKIDRLFNPNAENLNFATRADAFLSENGWQFFGRGKESLERFIYGNN